jgi:hypothetical protein
LSSLKGDPVTVSTYVILRDGCPVDFTVLGSDQVEVTCGERKCELLFDAESLRQFLADGTAALQDMDARLATESTEAAGHA